jgi:hypothetical protein
LRNTLKETIDISIVNSLVAATFGLGGDIARTEKTEAILTVELTAVPLPPAVWLMGMAIASLVSVGRREAQ